MQKSLNTILSADKLNPGFGWMGLIFLKKRRRGKKKTTTPLNLKRTSKLTKGNLVIRI